MIHRAIMLLLCALNLNQNQRCRLNTRLHFGEPLPVILRDNKLLEPTDAFGNIDLKHGDVLTLSCEEGGSLTHPLALRSESTATVTCEGGDSFKNEQWLNSPGTFREFKCLYPPNYKSVRTNRSCYDNHQIFEVGYRIQNRFYPVYESCFDQVNLNAIYSKYTQKPYNAFYQTRVDRPFFIADDVYGSYVPVNTLFSPAGQKSAVTQLIGAVAENYLTKTQFLSRGHLAAKTDFAFAFTERATFHYVNCAPQWTGFNGGNWNQLEIDLRNHIHAVGCNAIIYTGTFGVTKLASDYGRRVDMYLYSDENNNPVIPIPEYFYKVVYEPSSKCGIAFVGINNPYYTPLEAREMFFCEDLCRNNRNFSWLTWHPDNPAEGYTFCCTVPNFRATVPHLPEFKVNCLFT
ncbi:unnamed protein product [Arctia plantaginis]|uniref:DNA/RNA non-specific endonuclease/pyrophosphatase/phosphodiesterase domain-containing protein n=1 Tax=Arctia plantaginis TaxID=874455 RepID=A0A8S0ZFQ7_ARCPL|nr:unnamed protein product [Arctia plantaginis]